LELVSFYELTFYEATVLKCERDTKKSKISLSSGAYRLVGKISVNAHNNNIFRSQSAIYIDT
jgi:hypothetical protein